MLFELTRHSDHHHLASRKYQVLRGGAEGPQLPTGYPGMMILSLVPPLWFRTVEPIIHRRMGNALVWTFSGTMVTAYLVYLMLFVWYRS